MLSSDSGRCTEVKCADSYWRIVLRTKYTHINVMFHVLLLGFHRRTTRPALNKSGEKQGDHLYLSGAPHAHVSFTTLHPPATEESPRKSGISDKQSHVLYRHVLVSMAGSENNNCGFCSTAVNICIHVE